MAALMNPSEVPTLQAIAFGGEMLTTDIQSMWADEVILCNGYVK